SVVELPRRVASSRPHAMQTSPSGYRRRRIVIVSATLSIIAVIASAGYGPEDIGRVGVPPCGDALVAGGMRRVIEVACPAYVPLTRAARMPSSQPAGARHRLLRSLHVDSPRSEHLVHNLVHVDVRRRAPIGR